MAIKKASIQASRKLDAVLKAYDFHDHQHAIAVLTVDFPELLSEICDVLLAFRISIDQIKKAGGNESEIPKALSRLLCPLGWKEQELHVELKVDNQSRVSDSHNIDYVKGKVGFDFDWKKRRQTFGRDVYVFRDLMRERGVAVKAILTRCASQLRKIPTPPLRCDRLSQYYSECPTLFLSSTNICRLFPANDRHVAI